MPVRRRTPTVACGEGQFLALATGLDNPGALDGELYLPVSPSTAMPLVVVLHGCTQTANGYAAAAGWLELADHHGFAVLLPQQRGANNGNLCFNWFEPGDTKRGHGEVASVHAMIASTIANNAIDPALVFVTGLSAGAAMAGAMLATYPEVFAGGGLIAGLPYGTASSVQAALQQMRNGPRDSGRQLAARVSSAALSTGPWPRVSIWHGTADRTVALANGAAMCAQWLNVHGLADAVPLVEVDTRLQRSSWRDADGSAVVEYVELRGMGHGATIDLTADDPVGYAAPFVLDAGVAASVELCAFWGIGAKASQRTAKPNVSSIAVARPAVTRPRFERQEHGIEKIIKDALRTAGLLR